MCKWDLARFKQNVKHVAGIHQHIAKQASQRAEDYWEIIAKNSKLESKLQDESEWIDLVIAESDALRIQIAKDVFRLQKQVSSNFDMIDFSEATAILNDGIIINFYPQISLQDNTARVVSENFFNYANFPPFATWLYFFETNQLEAPHKGLAHYMCWIPPQYLEKATWGIESCPDSSLEIIDRNFDACYIETIQSMGMLG